MKRPKKNTASAKKKTTAAPVVIRPAGKNDWGQYRSAKAVWADLQRRGNTIVLGGPSNSTQTEVQGDYHQVSWCVRQLGQYVSQKKQQGEEVTLSQVKEDFKGTIIVGDETHVGYLTDAELQAYLDSPQTPSTFAEGVVTNRWGLTPSTAKTYIRRKPRKSPSE